MADKPQRNGLKLSMLIEPVNRPTAGDATARHSGAVPVHPTIGRVDGAPRSFTATRQIADLIDLGISIPIAGALLIGLPFAFAWMNRGSHGGAYAAIGLFFILVPYCIPLAAFLYSCLAYGLVGTTVGKRRMGLAVSGESGSRPTRKRLLMRPLINGAVLFAIAVALLVAVVIAAIFEDPDQRGGRTSVELMSRSFIFLPFLIIVFHVINRVLIRRGLRSLTDRLSKTEVVWKDGSGVRPSVE